MAKEKRLIDANALLEAYWEEQKKPGTYSIVLASIVTPTNKKRQEIMAHMD